MSSYKTITGFGGVKFQLSGRTVTFDSLNNKGEIEWNFEYYRRVTVNGKKIINLKWIDVKISTYLQNLCPDDYINFSYFFELINEAFAHSSPITIYPRFDVTSVYALSFDCFPVGKVKFDDATLYESGQVVQIDWEIEQPLTELPFMVNDIQNDFMLNEDGTFILDENGNKIIIER